MANEVQKAFNDLESKTKKQETSLEFLSSESVRYWSTQKAAAYTHDQAKKLLVEIKKCMSDGGVEIKEQERNLFFWILGALFSLVRQYHIDFWLFENNGRLYRLKTLLDMAPLISKVDTSSVADTIWAVSEDMQDYTINDEVKAVYEDFYGRHENLLNKSMEAESGFQRFIIKSCTVLLNQFTASDKRSVSFKDQLFFLLKHHLSEFLSGFKNTAPSWEKGDSEN